MKKLEFKGFTSLVDDATVRRVNSSIYIPKSMRLKVLHLTLHKKWFDEILNETKKIEYREVTDYWITRLHEREYDYIHFVNGYGKHRPWMDVEFIKCEAKWNGYAFFEYEIKLGKILRKGNIKEGE